MDFSVSQIPTIRGLRLEGELDIKTVELLEGLLDDAAAPGGPLFLDLTPLRFMDSTGIQAIMKALQEVAKTGWCLLLHIDNGEVARILEVVGLHKVPNVHIIHHPEAHTPQPA
jgi:anti-anti-sigma factor